MWAPFFDASLGYLEESVMEVDVPFLLEAGMSRRRCEVSGLFFWTSDPSRVTCGDTKQDEYTFIGTPSIQGFDQRGPALKDSIRSAFRSFFETRGHTHVDRYPVLARWRDDIHLTIASIADFQPHVTSGLVEPPANPLVISQPCIRLVDIASVGRSGRHLTTFEMMAHHAFNRPDSGEVHYWVNECVQMCHELMVEGFGIPSASVTYVENPWYGGGNAGAAVEVIVDGLELATLVFMDLEAADDGPVEIAGQRYQTMPLQIIDTGYGLERLCWSAAGTPTIYDAIYPGTIEHIKGLADLDARFRALGDLDLDGILTELSRSAGLLDLDLGGDLAPLRAGMIDRLTARGHRLDDVTLRAIIEPLECVYGLADHLQALCMMLGDGLVPSNSRAGYLARMVARRAIRMRHGLNIMAELPALATAHIQANDLTPSTQTVEGIIDMLGAEEVRYKDVLSRGVAVVKRMLVDVPIDALSVDDDVLFQLNDTHGLNPDAVCSIAKEHGWPSIHVREGIDAELAVRHEAAAMTSGAGDGEAIPDWIREHEPTESVYYSDVYAKEHESRILACVKHEDGWGIALASTIFYPEGGGQASDIGWLEDESKTRVEVRATQSYNGIIVHICDGPLEIDAKVNCILNWEHRKQVMDHHTAVHIVGGAARKHLGPHIFQAGANKNAHGARLDITHHRRLTADDLTAIENSANAVLTEIPQITKRLLDRRQADLEYGFDLYQGGAPKGSTIRVLEIGEHDIQACGGTHHDYPALIGHIRIVRATSPADGVERLHIVAGEAALLHAQRTDELVRDSSSIFDVSPKDLVGVSERFFEEWKAQRKRIESLEKELARAMIAGPSTSHPVIDGVRYVVMEVDGALGELRTISSQLTSDDEQPTVAVLGASDGSTANLLISMTEDTVAERHDAVALLKIISPHIQGGGGGRPTFAQGGGSRPEGIAEALDAARQELGLPPA